MAVRKSKAGLALKRWFKEDWKDVRTGKACGRKKGEKRGTPYCRPSKRISAKTPKTVSEMSAKVQFIFVTHNKISMEKSSHLLGVTMRDLGVSKVVSVDVEQAMELAQS